LDDPEGNSTLLDKGSLAAGELPTVRIGRAVRVPGEALEDWIREEFPHLLTMLPPFSVESVKVASALKTAPHREERR